MPLAAALALIAASTSASHPPPGLAAPASSLASASAPASAAASAPFWTAREFAHALPPSTMRPVIPISTIIATTMSGRAWPRLRRRAGSCPAGSAHRELSAAHGNTRSTGCSEVAVRSTGPTREPMMGVIACQRADAEIRAMQPTCRSSSAQVIVSSIGGA